MAAHCLIRCAKMSATNPNAPNLFPNIRTVAEKINQSTIDQPVGTAETQDPEQEEKAVEEIESLCMRCHEQGVTRMLLTSIPFFREIIVMSFRCEHCGWHNNEVQSAGSIRRTCYSVYPFFLEKQQLNQASQRKARCTRQECYPVRTSIARLFVLRRARFPYLSWNSLCQLRAAVR